jgi:hypothetical protein
LNVHWVNYVRQTSTYSITTSAEFINVEFEMAIEKLIRHKLQGTDKIPAKLLKAAGRKIRSEIHKCINII